MDILLKSWYLVFSFLTISMLSRAQYAMAEEGTYQIMYEGKREIVFTTEMMQEIENRRAQDQTVYWQMSPEVTIRIFSRDEIESPDFKGVPLYEEE